MSTLEDNLGTTLAAASGLGITAAGLLSGGSKGAGASIISGALLSFGADPLESGMLFKGSVFAFGDDGSNILKNSLMGRNGQVINIPGAGAGGSLPFGRASDLNLFTRGGGSYLSSGGTANLKALNFVAPALFTGIGAVNAMMDGGLSGAGEYLIQDFMGMSAANAQLNRVYEFDTNNAGKIESRFGLVKGEIEKAADGKAKGSVSIQRSMLGSPMLGTLVTSAGGIAGAGLGMEAGKAAGSLFGKQVFGSGGEGAFGMTGAVFGGLAGAKLGAAMTASLPRLAISGLGIAATTMIAKGTYGMLESGFRKEKMTHSKGLNFASDTSQFMTQRAVTMRQRAVQGMHKSHMNARSAFGQEATITHMNRDMFSHYKR